MDSSGAMLMQVISEWNRYIGRAFKCSLSDGMNPTMHYLLTQIETPTSMSDLARRLKMPKQQMTKLADRVIELGLAQRIFDPNDRRVILLGRTEQAQTYLRESHERSREYLQKMLDDMDSADEVKFLNAVQSIHEVFTHLDSKEREKKGN